MVIALERSERRVQLRPAEVRNAEPAATKASRPGPDGVAARSAASGPTRTATRDTAHDARARALSDPLAAQLRARADRTALDRTAADRTAATRLDETARIGDPGAPGGPDGSKGVARIEAVDPRKQEALALERELSKARQDLGKAQLELDNRNLVEKGYDWLTGGDDDQEKKVAQLQKRVDDLEAKEAKLEAVDPQAVGQARFTVYNERLAALEKEKGKGEAAKLARQTYYNSEAWSAAAGTTTASRAEINAAGFPHNGKYTDGQAVGGYGGEMIDPAGNPVDMGHVSCALDWEVNKDRLGRTYGNPFDRNAVTVSGDVASAMVNTPKGDDAARRAHDAIAAEGDADWNGDLDGQNIAVRLAKDPNASLASTVDAYYAKDCGGSSHRVDEWATHSKYVEKDASGAPKRDANGHYVVNKEQLQKDASNFTVVFSKGKSLIPGVDYEEGAVVDAFQGWLNGAQAKQSTN